MATISADPSLEATEAQARLHALEPRAFLITPRVLKKVIRADRGILGIGLHAPHARGYALHRDALLAIVEPDELGLPARAELPELAILLAPQRRPDGAISIEELSRLLFHIRIDLALADARGRGDLDDAALRRLTQRLGFVEADEAFRVVRQDDLVLPPEDLFAFFSEFVSLFFELRYFAPELLPSYFPAIEDLDAVEKALREIVDAEGIAGTTRLAATSSDAPSRAPVEPATEIEATPEGPGTAQETASLLGKADAAQERGNVVRAAILRRRAARAASAELAPRAWDEAAQALDRLATRLQAALHLDDAGRDAWRLAIAPLVAPASRGIWPVALRLLYDLQKACVDSERELFAVDLVEWACSLGRKPIKRPVPLQAQALLIKHLRSGLGRLARTPLADADRKQLADLLHAAIHHAEERFRDGVRPILAASLREVGFKPNMVVEELALGKVVEELLDRVVERGFINMGDVRDAIARNQLKMPDIAPGEIFLGDDLLRANRKLAVSLDGVYHRGEVYLRWLQRLSSLLFGTLPGRWLTLFMLMPFGGALATIVFTQEMLHFVRVHLHVPWPWLKGKAADHPATGASIDVPPAWAYGVLVALGVFFLLLLHVPTFRGATWRAAQALGRGLRAVFWDAPRALLRWPPLRSFLSSPMLAFFRRRIFRPLLIAAGAAGVSMWLGLPGVVDELSVGAAAFLLAFAFFNSRLGRRTEEAVADWLSRNWFWLCQDVVPGLVRLIIDLFRDLLDYLERLLYTVDEWLRFRHGQGRIWLVVKPVLGLFWFVITYLVRVVINLFVEPTVNPVKHFPAVTVGAKLIIPIIPMWTIAMTEALKPFLGLAIAGAIAGTVVVLFPGIFGFAVWEFKENWKLYAANRPRTLRPVSIGHHGETMLGLLKPGFHSGTLPKTFAKLRQALAQRQEGKAHRQEEALHHVSEAVRRFVERELLAVLGRAGIAAEVALVRLASNRIVVELSSAAGPENMAIAFEECSGWLVGSVRERGWSEMLSKDQAENLQAALAGLYKLAKVGLVRERIEQHLRTPYHIDARGLVIYSDDLAIESIYPLDDPQATATLAGRNLAIASLLFSCEDIAWDDWAARWEGLHDRR